MRNLLLSTVFLIISLLITTGCSSEINSPEVEQSEAITLPKIKRTVNVPQDYKTIQEAIDSAVDGDRILVSSGEYLENLLIDGKDIILEAEGDVFLAFQNSTDFGIQVYNGNVAILGFNIDAMRAFRAIYAKGGIDQFQAVSLTVKDCKIRRFDKSGIAIESPEAYGNIIGNEIFTEKIDSYYTPNAIQFSFGAKGRAINNYLTGGYHVWRQAKIIGVLVFESDGVIVKNNYIDRYGHGVMLTSYGWHYESANENRTMNNNIINCGYGVTLRAAYSSNFTTMGAVVNNNLVAYNKIIHQENVTDVYCHIGINLEKYNEQLSLENNLIHENEILNYEIPIWGYKEPKSMRERNTESNEIMRNLDVNYVRKDKI